MLTRSHRKNNQIVKEENYIHFRHSSKSFCMKVVSTELKN